MMQQQPTPTAERVISSLLDGPPAHFRRDPLIGGEFAVSLGTLDCRRLPAAWTQQALGHLEAEATRLLVSWAVHDMAADESVTAHEHACLYRLETTLLTRVLDGNQLTGVLVCTTNNEFSAVLEATLGAMPLSQLGIVMPPAPIGRSRVAAGNVQVRRLGLRGVLAHPTHRRVEAICGACTRKLQLEARRGGPCPDAICPSCSTHNVLHVDVP